MSDNKPWARPPSKPWKTGVDGENKTFRIEMVVVQDGYDRIWSEHGFQDGLSEATALSLEGGGVSQVAFAFLTEAVLTEIYACVLVELSKDDSDLVQRWHDGDEASQEEIAQGLANAARAVMFNTITKLGPILAKGVLTSMLESDGGST